MNTVTEFDSLLTAADNMTIHTLKRLCPLQDVNKALIDKSSAGFHLETVQARRFGKLTLMPAYSTLPPTDSFWGWRLSSINGFMLSSINGFMLSEHLFSKPTNALRALWICAHLFDPLLDDSGAEIKTIDPTIKNEVKLQFYVVCGIYGR